MEDQTIFGILVGVSICAVSNVIGYLIYRAIEAKNCALKHQADLKIVPPTYDPPDTAKAMAAAYIKRKPIVIDDYKACQLERENNSKRDI